MEMESLKAVQGSSDEREKEDWGTIWLGQTDVPMHAVKIVVSTRVEKGWTTQTHTHSYRMDGSKIIGI